MGFVHQTVRNLLNRYLDGGLQALLNENRGGRRRSYMTHEEEEAFLKEQLSSAINGEFVTVSTLFEAYQEKVGRKTTREGFYALLKRRGLVKESRDSLRWEISLRSKQQKLVLVLNILKKQTQKPFWRLKIKSLFKEKASKCLINEKSYQNIRLRSTISKLRKKSAPSRLFCIKMRRFLVVSVN